MLSNQFALRVSKNLLVSTIASLNNAILRG